MFKELDSRKHIDLIRLHPTILEELYNVISPLKPDLDGAEIWNQLKKVLPDPSALINAEEREEFELGKRLIRKSLKGQFNASPFRSIFRVAFRYSINLVLVEVPYLDLEYWESFAHLYSRTFSNIPRAGCRLHFFKLSNDTNISDVMKYFHGGPLPSKNIIDNMMGGTNICEGLDYYGFAVIRPTPNYKIGRTALAFDRRPGKDLDSDITDPIDRRSIPICTALILQKANVMCRCLQIKSVPFMQQDPIVGVCASTATWVALQVASQKFQLNMIPYWDISKYAFGGDKDFSTGKEFIRGLYVSDIRRAFNRAGANSYIVTKKKRHIMRRYIFSLIDSNIPPVVCLSSTDDSSRGGPGHAVAVTAYGLPDPSIHRLKLPSNKDDFCGTESVSGQYFLADFIERFYVHDDTYGPFNRLTFKSESAYLRRVKDDLSRMWLSRKSRVNIDGVIMPFPSYVKNPPDILSNISVQIMNDFFLNSYAKIGSPNILWRIVLVEGTKFKRSLQTRGYCEEHIEQYSKIHMSKYIWLAEFTAFRTNGGYIERSTVVGNDDKRLIDGEFIFDSSFPAYGAKSISFRSGTYLTTDSLEDWNKSTDVLSKIKKDDVIPTGGEPRQICFPNIDSLEA